MRKIFTIICLLISTVAIAQHRDTMYVSGGKLVLRDATIKSGKAYIEVDGNVFTGKLSSIKPDDIQEFSIIKISDAQQMFGTKGQNGAYFIKTKAGQKVLDASLNPASIALDTAKEQQYNHALSSSVSGNSDSSTYVVDGEPLTKKEADKINPENIISINVLKKDKNSFETSLTHDVIIIVTTTGAVKSYQKKFGAISKEYKAYLDANKNDDSALLYMNTVNGEIYYPTNKDRIKAIYDFSNDIKTLSFSRRENKGVSIFPAMLSIETNKQN
ncbi:hypothetical protein SAMN05216464_105154 [Mucilaginibacter pineti]|uniref:DUF4369 domain-containing protein n=1 Tax=Mucilaginibacter pineti TaxID=1391627 RepID=A0A1G7BVD4_9SPHI|nr:hypothetical protein [Mucilaginibacter pineti]SDE30155.1 hypothetical protein SAMN05216464_105154 [Mucilaginibacter pineti]